MPLEIEYVDKSRNITEIFVFDAFNPKKRRKTYKINEHKKEIVFYPYERFFLKNIFIKGFGQLPRLFNEKGYMQQGLVYYLGKMLREKDVCRLTISKEEKASFRKKGSKYEVVINYQDLKELRDKLAAINNESKFDKSQTVDESFHNFFPKEYPKIQLSSSRRAKRVISNLDNGIIEHLEKQDIEILLDFFEKLLSSKYKSAVHKRELFKSAKIKVDDVALTDIVAEFEELLKRDPVESKWGEFLNKNLFLLDSKYIKSIPQLNVVLAGARKVDFGLIDSQGYLDIFEIKRPSTKLLAKKQDRGNYYWHTDAIKSVVQAEKYLFDSASKRGVLKDDILREKDIAVDIIRPRAFVVIGTSNQLIDKKQKDDFRILRTSLKNIEIVLYDELLERLKNQKNKIYYG